MAWRVLPQLRMELIDRARASHVLLPLAIGTTLALAGLSALSARAILLRLPADFLAAPPAPTSRARAAGRTLAGVTLVAVGIALLLLPGPGVAVIVLGVLMLAPARRARIVRSILKRPRLLREVNAFRRRHGRAELANPHG